MALVLTGLSGVLTGVNIVATVICMRAPGMTMFRMPIFTWNMLVTSVLVLIAFPVLTAAGAMLFADRHLGAHIFDADNGGSPILWQHLFWFFGHPEVYILVLPYFGVITEILPVFSRRPVFGYQGLVFATLAIASLSVGVWAHHMFTTGAVLLRSSRGCSMLIAVPTGVKFFNWIGTMWGGRINFKTPMVFALGFLVTFLLGGLTGVLLASAPIDLQSPTRTSSSPTCTTCCSAARCSRCSPAYYWFPKSPAGSSRRLGPVHFCDVRRVPPDVLRAAHPRPRGHAAPLRATARRRWTSLNLVSSIGAFLIGVSTLPFLWNVWRSRRRRDSPATIRGSGQTLEWATASPPPPANFDGPLPPIRSNRPVWDLHHGQPARERSER